MLGRPFLRLWPGQPFPLVDLACYLLAFHGFRDVARAFGVRPSGALTLYAATTLAQFGIAKLWIEPWTTTPSAALLWMTLGAMARLWREDLDAVARRRSATVLGLALGLLPFARPGDAFVGGVVAAAAAVAIARACDRRAAIDGMAASRCRSGWRACSTPRSTA